MPRCRDCKLYDLDAVRSKSGAVLSSHVARCLWVSTEVLPISANRGRRAPELKGGWMQPNEVHNCQRFIERTP